MLKTYILKNKNKSILSFCIENIKKRLITTNEEVFESNIISVDIFDKNAIPFSLKDLETSQPYNNLENWIQKRKAPNHRKNINKILQDCDSLTNYIDISFGLSLNDSFWIISQEIEKDFSWESVNLYKNKFDERLALAAFGLMNYNADDTSLSPEFTTDGGLPKCWNRVDNKIELLKGIEENVNQGLDNYTEFYISQIAEVLGLNSIKYDLKEFKNILVSSCELFTDENNGFIQIGKCIDKTGIKQHKGYIDKIVPIYGKEAFFDLMVFDALIYNIDRHLGNFGMIIDNDTQTLLRPAPIFDNGNSIINILTDDEYNGDIQEILKYEKSWFGYTFDEQLETFTLPKHAKMYEKLLNFKFTRHEKYNIDETRLLKIQNVVQERSKRIVDLALKLQIQQNEAIENEPEIPSFGLKM